MKSKFNLFLAALLIFICCMGAASAADDISDDSLTIDDETVVAKQVDDVDLQSAESDDATLEVNNAENENLRATSVTVTNWSQLAGNASSSGDKTINLASGVTYTPTSQIVFGNNAKIVGTSTSYISGSYSGIPFYNSNSNYHITFQNVKFKDISCTMLMQMLTTGTTVLDGCTFTNVNASSSGHNSVIYNNYGTMNITDCTFTNCRAAFGVVTNHNAASTTNVIMNVRGCTFENNYGYTEPGCINNCGQLYVWNSIFNNNHAVWWAGAIHTHTNAKSVIRTSSFNGNTAGWNGGALYTYSTLEVYKSNFTNNNCSTNNGGGAIGASNYFFASTAYNVTVKCCNFINNHNLASSGNGGAIAAMNGGTLTVTCSNFTRNSADNGQAICGFNTNEYANISEGNAHLVITNNNFINHDIKTGTTVKLEGDYYTFEDNTFTNSPQIAYNDDNDYDIIITASSPISPSSINEVMLNSKNEVLGVSFEEIIGESEVIYISQEDIDKSKSALNNAIQNAQENATIIIRPDTTITRASSTYSANKNITVIGENRETVLVTSHAIRSGGEVNKNNTWTWVNVTFSCSIDLSNNNYKFINCTFKNSLLQFDGSRSSYTNPDVYNYAFENCEFVNYTQNNVVVANKFANVSILNCAFDNVTADAIVSTNANRTDDSGRQAGVTIKDSTFKDVTVKGIVKAQNYSVAAVTTDNKYDFATQKTLASDDAVYMDVPVNATTLTVKVADIKEGEDFTIEVTLSNNLTANVSVVINQKEYNVSVVNGTGSLNVTDKLAPNSYDVEASYAGEYPYAASTNTTTFKVEKVIVNTFLTAPKVSATYNVAKSLVITLKDANGKALVGKYVSVKVGTISKNIQTDKNGQVSVNVASLVPKSYTATISFAGDDDYNKASTTANVVVAKATPKLTTKKLTTKVKVKTKKVTATLKDNIL